MRRLLLALLAVAATPALAETWPEGQVIHYACSGGAHLSVAYLSPPDGSVSYAVVVFDGKMIPMKAGPTGSGVRYVSLDRSKRIWHVKGDAGVFARDDAEQTMIADCTAMR